MENDTRAALFIYPFFNSSGAFFSRVPVTLPVPIYIYNIRESELLLLLLLLRVRLLGGPHVSDDGRDVVYISVSLSRVYIRITPTCSQCCPKHLSYLCFRSAKLAIRETICMYLQPVCTRPAAVS